MKKLLIIAVALLLGFLMASAAWYYTKLKKKGVHHTENPRVNNTLMRRLNGHAQQLQSYASHNGYNTNICFLLDMQVESGKNRFFVYDMKKDSLLDAGLVTHGRCNQDWLTGRKYGNDIGCGCTSLGKYKIGKPVHPYPICQSDGCPTVSPNFLKELQPILDKSSKPVLLWIFQ